MLARRTYSTDLSDEEWQILLEPPLVPRAKNPAADQESTERARAARRHLLLRGEGRMRLAPLAPRLSYSRQTAYHYFRLWPLDGTWEKMHTAF